MPAPPVVIKEEREWIAAIDAQIDRLQQARAILTGGKSTARRHHHMSPEARARISAGAKEEMGEDAEAAWKAHAADADAETGQESINRLELAPAVTSYCDSRSVTIVCSSSRIHSY